MLKNLFITLLLLPIFCFAAEFEENPLHPCEGLVGSPLISDVDLLTDIGTMSMSTVAGMRDTTWTMDIFNLGTDLYKHGACMAHDSYVRARVTRLCPTVHQYSSFPEKLIPINILAGSFKAVTLQFKLAGSGDTPVCSMYFFEVEVDHSQKVWEPNELNNNTEKFCYHIEQGILTAIQPQTAQDCVKAHSDIIYQPKPSRR